MESLQEEIAFLKKLHDEVRGVTVCEPLWVKLPPVLGTADLLSFLSSGNPGAAGPDSRTARPDRYGCFQARPHGCPARRPPAVRERGRQEPPGG